MNHIKLKKSIFLSFYILFLMVQMACEQVIDLDLKTPTPRLVVEGRIEKMWSGDPVGQQTIKLTTVSDFFRNAAPPMVSGAQVWVMDPNGSRFDFIESEDGFYVNHDLQHPESGTYHLNIIWEGQTYLATEELIPVVRIDSIYQFEAEENLFEDGGIKLAINFTDPPGRDNFYFWETHVDEELRILPDPGNKNNVIANDDFFDGQSVEGYLPNEELVVEPGSRVVVKQIGLSENAYQYYYTLFDQAGKTGSILDTPPALVRGNIVNQDDPGNVALGYFYVTEIAKATKTITE